jgi:SAM-dependent methyltransferase
MPRQEFTMRHGSNTGKHLVPHGLVIAAGCLAVGRLAQRGIDGFRWYKLVYRLIYRLGLIVWRRAAPPDELVALVEGPRALPPGHALDVGCGTGTDTLYLAAHGWDVTGVDMVTKALATARRSATAAKVAPRFVHGDVTRLDELGVGDGYTLLVDFGCFHTLPDDRRPAYVAGISHAAAPGATLLLYGFRRPPKAAPMHAGITTDEVERRFIGAGWHLIHSGRTTVKPTAIRRANDLFELWHYQLRRTSA